MRGLLRPAAGAGGEGGAHQRRPAPDGREKTEQNPGGTPIEVFDGFRKALAANRAQFISTSPPGPFPWPSNRDGAEVLRRTIQNCVTG